MNSLWVIIDENKRVRAFATSYQEILNDFKSFGMKGWIIKEFIEKDN